MSGAVSLDIRQVSRTYRSRTTTVQALDEVTFRVPAGSFVSLLGPSGCGKSTLFSLVVGLDEPDSGRILLDDVEQERLLGRSAYMPQKDALLPWLRVVDNVAIGLTSRGIRRREARGKALPLLERFGLADFAWSFPSQLSGGMRQRAAFLRTVLTGRPLLLLDEPFGALDSVTRQDMQAWLLDVWTESGATVVLVTHDVAEAVYLSDTVHVLTARPGRVHATVEIDLPRPRPARITETDVFGRLEARLRRELRLASAPPPSHLA